MQRNRRHPSIASLRFRCIHKDRTIIWPDWNVSRETQTLYGVIRNITTQKTAEDKQKHQAYHDALTDLPNRHFFLEHLQKQLGSPVSSDTKVAVMYLDLDNFKTINDTLGHAIGDALLQSVSSRLRHLTKPQEVMARLGGDEFALFIPGVTSVTDVNRTAESIIEALRPGVELSGKKVFITTSIGIAVATAAVSSAQQLLQAADIALYRSKAKGRGRYTLFDRSMNADAFQRMEIELELRRAVANDEFVLHYQPMVDVTTGNIVGFEALVRWQHPTRGLLHPEEFLPLAQEAGMDLYIDKWVLRSACG